jgi:hypothetical protein
MGKTLNKGRARMTARDIIRKLSQTVLDWDKEIPLQLLYRDREGSVEQKVEFGLYNIINGKIYVEAITANLSLDKSD